MGHWQGWSVVSMRQLGQVGPQPRSQILSPDHGCSPVQWGAECWSSSGGGEGVQRRSASLALLP